MSTRFTIIEHNDRLVIKYNRLTMNHGLKFTPKVVKEMIALTNDFKRLFMVDQYYIRFPATSILDLDRPFTYSIKVAYGLDQSLDSDTFAEHLNTCREKHCIVFRSHNNSKLVVPCKMPRTPALAYRYISDFHEFASFKQNTWKAAGHALIEEMCDRSSKFVLNTHGNSVAWLHIRVDLHS